MPYAPALVTDANPNTLKAQLETATGMNFAAFKAKVESAYERAKSDIVKSAKDLFDSEHAKQVEGFAADPSKTLTEIKDLTAKLAKVPQKTPQEEAKLAEAKKQALFEISQMNELPNSVKNDYSTKVNNATTVAEVEAIKQEAAQDVATRKQIAAKKATAKETLTKKDYLYPDEPSNYLDRLENAGTEAEIDSLLQEAEATAAANKVIFEKRENIIKEIEKLRYLSQEQKADFKGQLEELQTEDQLQAVLQEARKANVQALKDTHKELLQKTKQNLKAIKELPEVTDESLYKAQMEIWKFISPLLDDYVELFDNLNPEKYTDLFF